MFEPGSAAAHRHAEASESAGGAEGSGRIADHKHAPAATDAAMRDSPSAARMERRPRIQPTRTLRFGVESAGMVAGDANCGLGERPGKPGKDARAHQDALAGRLAGVPKRTDE